MSKNSQVELFKKLQDTPITIFPIYVKVTGRLTTAYLLSLLIREFRFFDLDKIYRTDQEIIDRCHLSERELRTAKEDIKEMPFLTVTRESGKGRTHYAIDWDKFHEICGKTSDEILIRQNVISTNPDSTKRRNTSDETSELIKTRNKDTLCPTRPQGGIGQNVSLEDSREKVFVTNARMEAEARPRPTELKTAQHAESPKERLASSPSPKGKSAAREVDRRFLRMAEQLAAPLRDRGVLLKSARMAEWAQHFEIIHNHHGVPLDRLQSVLDRYCARLRSDDGWSDEYRKVAHSGEAFKRKFSEIEMYLHNRETKEARARGEVPNGHPLSNNPALRGSKGRLIVDSRSPILPDEN